MWPGIFMSCLRKSYNMVQLWEFCIIYRCYNNIQIQTLFMKRFVLVLVNSLLSSHTHPYCTFLTSRSPWYSDTIGLWSVSLVILGLVSWFLLQRWCPPPHTVHPLAAGQCWRPLPWDGGTDYMCITELYETPVTHKHRYCQYSTLGLSHYDYWTEKYCCNLEHFLVNAKMFVIVKLWTWKTCCSLVLELLWVCFNGNKRTLKSECSRALGSYVWDNTLNVIR